MKEFEKLLEVETLKEKFVDLRDLPLVDLAEGIDDFVNECCFYSNEHGEPLCRDYLYNHTFQILKERAAILHFRKIVPDLGDVINPTRITRILENISTELIFCYEDAVDEVNEFAKFCDYLKCD